MSNLENIKEDIKVLKKSITILQKCKKPDKLRDGMFKVATIVSKVSENKEYVHALISADQYDDSKIFKVRDIILTMMKEQIKLDEDFLKQR